MTQQLLSLTADQVIPFGGDRYCTVPAALAAAFTAGDRLIVVQEDGALLHITAADASLVDAAVTAAQQSFAQLAACADAQISQFFEAFAQQLLDPDVFGQIQAANDRDVAQATARQRSTTRLALTESMRAGMIAGLRVWRDLQLTRDEVEDVVDHGTWSVTTRRAPLGIVGFVFEGRPNVFADAAGVLRSGNVAVLRIGSDALGTAQAMMRLAVQPALVASGLPAHAIALIESASRATGWALFNDARLSLAVARGSGAAVSQLGAVARQAGVPASLHGTGGAWMVVSAKADATKLHDAVRHSLDRKVCNTLNVCCVQRSRAPELVPIVLDALIAAGQGRGSSARVHVVARDLAAIDPAHLQREVQVQRADGWHTEPFADAVAHSMLSHEWEWEQAPEITLVLVDDLNEAATLFNEHSPRLAASLISDDADEHRRFQRDVDAPFVGNATTRWVDGQFALNRPELGLSNWANGRLLARSAVLSGDSVFTRRLFATMADPAVHR